MCLQRLPRRTGQVFMITPAHCWVLLYRARMVLRECLQQVWFAK